MRKKTSTKSKKAQAGGNRPKAQDTKAPDHLTAHLVPLSSLRPSPENDDIYGPIDRFDPTNQKLAEDIRVNGVHEPIIASEDGWIISGHRRFAAATVAGLDEVPVRTMRVQRSSFSKDGWKRHLVSYNFYQRHKNGRQILKEATSENDVEYSIEAEVAAFMASAVTPSDINLQAITIGGETERSRISPNKFEMLNAAIAVINSLRDFRPLSVRSIHYGLLNLRPLKNSKNPASVYKNDRASYQDLCDLLARARLAGLIPWQAIHDETRKMIDSKLPQTYGDFASGHVSGFLQGYRRDLLQSQPNHVELLCEKLTVWPILEPIAMKYTLPSIVGRGYASIPPRKSLEERYRASVKDELRLIVVSDCDPDGMGLAKAFAKSMRDDFGIDKVSAYQVALTPTQIDDWRLPPSGMKAKKTSARFKEFVKLYGSDDVYELEAAPPERLQEALEAAIRDQIDIDAFTREKELERQDIRKLLEIRKGVLDHVAAASVEDD